MSVVPSEHFFKSNYFKKQRFVSSYYISFHGNFGPVYLLQVRKNVDEIIASKNNLTSGGIQQLRGQNFAI